MANNTSTQNRNNEKDTDNPLLRTRKSMGVFTRLARITALANPSEVLDKVTTEITDLMEAAGCSIYLVPDFIPDFKDVLVKNGVEILFNKDDHDHIVVLAATTRADMKPFVGQAFYRIGEGITGWVYQHKLPLNIKNTSDEKELHSIASDLVWKDAYGGSKYYYKGNVDKSLLIVPLIFGDRQLGVIKFMAHQRPFTDFDEKLAILVAQIVSSAMHHSAENKKQNKTIFELIEIGTKHDEGQIFIELSNSMSDLLQCEKSEIYIFSDDENSALQLKVKNGKTVKNGQVFTRGMGLVGWVYKTGKPLIIDDLRSFCLTGHLSDECLEKYSDSIMINDSDRTIFCEEIRDVTSSIYPTTFIAVPVIQDNEVLGVLAAQSRYGNSFKRSGTFSRPDELNLAVSFARIASNALEYGQEKRQGNLLIKLGTDKDIQDLFELVIQDIPKLVSSAGCSIFEFKKGVQGPYLQLVKSSRNGLVRENGSPVPLTYKLGEGKTGICGLSKCTVVINHYDIGEVSESTMDEEVERVASTFPSDYLERLLDENGIQVGLIHVRSGKSCSVQVKEKLQQLTDSQHITAKGLSSKKLEKISPSAKPSWSFAAIPIQDKEDLFGVITISRPVPGNPFSRYDISTLESIARRLGHVIGNIKMQEQRKELLMTLAHEVNTPLTGILADSENLKNESNSPEMKKLADNIIEQVLRLHLFTETIMGAVPGISEDGDGSNIVFEFVNIREILVESRKLFMAEAAFKGCDILEPKAIGDEIFPQIEMSRFHLGIAIKNLVHNAVKYSYRPVQGGEKRRFINIWGIWTSGAHQIYKINIQNYGVGISFEEIEKRLIFEPFYRGKKAGDRRRTGAGFGLSYARQIIEEMHHGKIKVTSVPAGPNVEGKVDEAHITTFTISLPVVHKPLQ